MGSFGKNNENLDRVTSNASMSQAMGHALTRPQGQSGGAPYWANNYRPTEGTVDTVRLIPGDYTSYRFDESGHAYTIQTPWFEAVEHYHGGLKRGALCSAGVYKDSRKKKEPCLGCEIFWEDFEIRKQKSAQLGEKVKNPNRISKRNIFVFHLLDKGYFYRGPKRDHTGKVVTNESNGQTITDWVKWTGAAHQQHEIAQTQERRYGKIMDYVLGRDHFQSFSTYADLIGKNCMGCGGQNCLHVPRWLCEKCNSVVLDTTTAMLSEEQIKDIVYKPCKCGHCQHYGYPKEQLSCQYCPNPKRATIFDVDFNLTQSKDHSKNRTQLIVQSYSTPAALEHHFHELLEKKADLARKFAPTPYADQRALFQQAGNAHEPPPGVPPATAYPGPERAF